MLIFNVNNAQIIFTCSESAKKKKKIEKNVKYVHAFIVNFEHISHLLVVLLLLTSNKQL